MGGPELLALATESVVPIRRETRWRSFPLLLETGAIVRFSSPPSKRKTTF
jgi:hypothetical protein